MPNAAPLSSSMTQPVPSAAGGSTTTKSLSSNNNNTSLLDEAFALLGEATKLEHNASSSLPSPPDQHRQQDKQQWDKLLEKSASKYHEACYLMKRHVGRIHHHMPESAQDSSKMRQLLVDRIDHYERHAEGLMTQVKEWKQQQRMQGKQSSLGNELNLERNQSHQSTQSTLSTQSTQSNSSSGSASRTSWEANHNSQLHSSTSAANSYSYAVGANNVPPASAMVTARGTNHAISTKNNEEATQAAGKATAQLATAIDCDERGDIEEAKRCYMNAVQWYLTTVKLLSSTSEGRERGRDNGASHDTQNHEELVASLKRKIKVALDRVEELKQSVGATSKNQNQNVNKNSNNSQNSYPESPNHPPGATTAKTNSSSFRSSSQNKDNEQSLTPYEIAVLRRSSMIASGLFLPWSDEEARTYNFFSPMSSSPRSKTSMFNGNSAFVVPWDDPDGLLPLSNKQKERFFKWARPSEIIAMRSASNHHHHLNKLPNKQSNSQSTTIKMVHSTITPYTIKQHCVSDCSFVAGLCISSAFERRFHRKLVSSLIYPQREDGMPVYNSRGMYMVKLWLNGVARRVMVDDLLPVDRHGNLLCSHTTVGVAGGSGGGGFKEGDVLELWVSILEKAYMKLCGGYNFPGSNSGVDLFSLTGWIPERIFFPEDPNVVLDFETPTERAWERLYSANSYGDCLITVSTSKELTEEKAEEVGLFTAHAYAVLGVVQTSNGTRLLQLKNPWASQGWKGRYSCYDKHSWSDPAFCHEVGYNPIQASQHDDGIFWISWDDLLVYFRNLHLSWNPDLFRCRTTMHGFWKKEMGPVDDSFNVGENPQYTVVLSDKAIKSQATLWILLSRHVTKQEQEGGEVTDYLTPHIHRISHPKQRVWYPGGTDCVLTGAYTNNQHVLVRYDAKGPEDKYLSIVLSQYQKSHDLGYTLSCYCTSKFKLGQPEVELPLYRKLEGSWGLWDSSNPSVALTIGSAGGPPGKGSFGSNPQWSITVPAGGASLQFKCLAMKTLPVNVVLVQINQNQQQPRVHHLYEEPVIDSGNYRHGFAVTERKEISAGQYTLVASTFEVGKEGNFVVCIHSSKEVAINVVS